MKAQHSIHSNPTSLTLSPYACGMATMAIVDGEYNDVITETQKRNTKMQ